MRHITVRQLQIFVEAAEAPSFAQAAERIHVTPAAISSQLRQIESMSGFALFERIGRKTRLTDAGSALLGYARIVLQALSDADQALTALRGITGGRVKLGLVSTAKYFVPHLIARFTELHPDVTIDLHDGNRNEVLTGVADGDLDLAITGRPPETADVMAEPFAANPSVIIAAPSHKLTRYASLPATVLAGEKFIMREEGAGTRSLAERFARDAGISLRVTMTTSSNEMIKQAVMANAGIALISANTIGLEAALGLIKILPVEGFPLTRQWFICRRRGMPLLPVHALLLRFITDQGRGIIDALEAGYLALKAGRPAALALDPAEVP